MVMLELFIASSRLAMAGLKVLSGNKSWMDELEEEPRSFHPSDRNCW